MGERLTKEVRLELKAVQGDVTAFDLVSNRLHMIEAQIKRIKALSTEPIALKITANMPYIPGVSPTGGGFGTGGLGGGVGITPPPTPPPPPSFGENIGGFDPKSAIEVKTAAEGTVEVGKSFGAFGKSFQQYFSDSAEMNRILVQNKTNLQALASQGFVSVERRLDTTAKGVSVLSEKFAHADGRIASLNHTTGKFSTQMEKSAKDTRVLGDSIGHTVSKVLLWAISTGIIYGSLRAIMSLKDEMIKVDYQSGRLQRVFAGTASELEKLKGQSIELGAALGIVPSQAIETAVSIARLQKDRTQTLEILRVALLSQNVAELTVEESIKFTTAAILQFNLSAFQAIRVLDQWNQLSNTNRVLTRDLGDSVAIAGRAFFEAGTNIETLNAYTTALTQTMGQSGNQIGTALRTIAVYAQSVSRAGKASQIAGFQIYDAATNSVMPLGEIIGRLAVRFDTLSDAERNSLTETIAGVRRRTQLLVLLQQYPDVLKAHIQQYQSANSAIKEQEVVSRTLQFQIQRLGAEFKQLGVNAGEGGVLSVMKTLTIVSRLFVGALGTNNAVAQLLAATMAALAARFIINQAIYVASRKEISGLGAGVVMLTKRFYALAVAQGTAAAAGAALGAVFTGLLKLAAFMIVIYGITKGLGWLADALAGFDSPTALEERLQAIQAALIKTATFRAAEQNVREVIAALEDLNNFEASGGTLSPYNEKIRTAGIATILALTDEKYSEQEIINLLKTKAGQLEILNSIRENGNESEQNASKLAAATLKAYRDNIKKYEEEIAAKEAKLERLNKLAASPDIPGVGAPTGYVAQIAISIDETEKSIAGLKDQVTTTKESIANLQNELSSDKMKQFGDAAEDAAESLKELEAEFKKVLDAQERLAMRKGRVSELYAIDDVEKAQTRLQVLDEYIAGLEKQRDELEKIKQTRRDLLRSGPPRPGQVIPGFTNEDAMHLKTINEELRRFKERRDEALVDIDVASRSKQMTDAAEKMKNALDFDIEVSGVLSEDALERAASKYAIITRELERINRQLADAEKNGRSMEEVTALRIRSAELEKDQLRAAKDLQLERLRTEIDITREMERQVMSAEQSYLFADRETQAKARILAHEWERGGRERMKAEEFAQLAPDTRRIIKEMIPGLLPVEALSKQMRSAMGAPSAQLSYEQLLGLSPASRREAAEYFPGMMPGQEKGRYELKGPVTVSATEIKVGDLRIPLTPNKFVIPDIPVPVTKFILPEKIDLSGAIIMPTSASGAKTGVPAAQSAAQPVLNIPEDIDARLGTVFDSFITKQEGVTKELARIFSEQKQRSIELDVDINFAGVQGPLTNLVTRFSHIVEQRLNEKVDALAAKLSSAAQPKRPNVNAEVY